MNKDLLEKILSQGFPTQRHEQWKYTDVHAIASRKFIIDKKSAQAFTVIPDILKSYIISENYIIFINGYRAFSSWEKHKDKDSIKLNPTKQANSTLSSDDIFENLNYYFHQESFQIVITEKLHHPLQILYLGTTENWIQTRNRIILENNSKANIIETFISTAAAVVNTVTEIEVNPKAALSYYKIQQENAQAFHIGRTYITVQKNAQAKTYTFSSGALLARSDISVKLAGEGAQTELYGLYISKNRTHLDHHTLIEHAAPYTKSTECYHGILMDHARAVFNGKVIVQADAHHTEAEQANHNLLLSSDAEIDTKPELEIYCDEIKCTHGATIGQLDENAIFYLRTRGLDEITAKKLLIQAFSNKILNYISNDTLREKICLIL